MGTPNKQYWRQLRYLEEAPSVNVEMGNPNLTLAGILDDPLSMALDFECNIIQLYRDSWQDMLNQRKPQLLVVEAFSKPEDVRWLDDLNSDPNRDNQLYNLILWCSLNRIPTVFWQKHSFQAESFRPFLPLFDQIFMEDIPSVSQYREIFGSDCVHYLSPALQPRLHNPILNTYPKDAYEQMTCYHRMSPSAKETLLELSQVLYPQATSQLLDETIDPEIKDKVLVTLFRELLKKHTYKDRLDSILQALGIPSQRAGQPGVTILTATNRIYSLEKILANYSKQDYPNKELIILVNNDQINYEQWVQKTMNDNNIHIYRVDERKPLGYCLNFGIDQSRYDYVTKFDDDNYYGPHFLVDLMNSYQYANAEIVGKLSYYVYLEGIQTLGIMCPYFENMYTNFLAGSGLIIKKEVFDAVRFGDKPRGSDSVFLKECAQKGIRMYSADRFNYVVLRHPAQPDHTWQVSDNVFLYSSKIIGKIDNYVPLVTL